MADAIKEQGWEFASHTWGHMHVGDASMERLQEYLKEHPAEIILAGERPAAELEALGTKKTVMILSEAEVVREKEAGSSIYKYQSGSGIMREVMAAYCCSSAGTGLEPAGQKAVVMGVIRRSAGAANPRLP